MRRFAICPIALIALILWASGAVASEGDEGAGERISSADARRATEAFIRGNEHYEAGRYSEALREFEAAHEIDRHARTRFNIGQCHYRLRQWDEALEAYQHVTQDAEQMRRTPHAHLLAAECLLRRDPPQPDRALAQVRAYMRRAEAADLANEEEDTRWARDLQRRCEEAGASAEPSGEEFSGDPEAARPLHERGTEAYRERRYEEAAEIFQQAFDAWQWPDFMYNIAQCHRLSSHHEEAVAAYQRRLEMDPSPDPITYILMGECLYALGRRQEANQAFRQYLSVESQGEYAGQARRAAETGELPSDQDRRDPEQVREAQELYDRAAALYREQQYEQAAQLFLQGYERMPNMHEFLYNAGNCYMEAQRWGDAARTYSRYVRTPGAAHDAWAFLGDCHAQQGQVAEAVQAYQRYIELEPRGELADQARRYVNDARPAEGGTTRATPQEIERARALAEIAQDFFLADRYQEALESFEQAYEIVPSRFITSNMGVCCARLDRHEEAVRHFERCLQGGNHGTFADAHLDAAESLLALNRPGDAARHIDAYMTRAREADLPNEEQNMQRARRLQQRAGGGSSS